MGAVVWLDFMNTAIDLPTYHLHMLLVAKKNSLSVTLYSVLAANCYWHFSVNKFKTLDKTNKINNILCRLKVYLLTSVFHQKCEQTVNMSGTKKNRTRTIYITDQISLITWREMTDKKCEVKQTRRWRKSFKTKCKSTRFKPVDFWVWH